MDPSPPAAGALRDSPVPLNLVPIQRMGRRAVTEETALAVEEVDGEETEEEEEVTDEAPETDVTVEEEAASEGVTAEEESAG
jgi:hypothetical protein